MTPQPPPTATVRSEAVNHPRYTLLHGDCLELLPTLTGIDAVVTDPPYGMGKWGKPWAKNCGKSRLWDGTPEWDEQGTSAALIAVICKISPKVAIWGGNYFENLPPMKGWMIWDKCANMTQSHAELAWTNFLPAVRMFRKSPLGVWGNGGRNGELKVHPTQKPLELMIWCLSFLPEGCTILDPFMGSGTTGVACMQTGRNFIGIELDAHYFSIAQRRIEDAAAQPSLFEVQP